MMAVDSKQGGTNGNGASGPAASTSSPSIAAGTGSAPRISESALPKRKRSSSLMKSAGGLPNVEHSLEEFIAKANQTLVDVSSWEEAKEQDAKRKEQDAMRWKTAEGQMRESEAREQSLRRQLDGLQGKLAEAEARAAVAGTQMGSAAHDSQISDLKTQIEKSMSRMRAAEERSQELSQELAQAKADGSSRTPLPMAPNNGIDEDEAAERVRLAEAKAAKALAAARAAQAGLTVSSADLAAIESGLVVVDPPKKSSPVLPIALAFIGGLGIMFVVWKFVLNKETKPAANAAQPVQAQPAQAQPPAPPPTAPVVTPIEEKPTPAVTEEAKKGPTVTPIEEPKKEEIKEEPKKEEAPAAVKEEPVKEEPAAVKEEPKKAEPKKAPVKAAPVKKAAPKAAPKKETKKTGIADPFAETPAPKKETKKPAAEKKPAGGIVDPF